MTRVSHGLICNYMQEITAICFSNSLIIILIYALIFLFYAASFRFEIIQKEIFTNSYKQTFLKAFFCKNIFHFTSFFISISVTQSVDRSNPTMSLPYESWSFLLLKEIRARRNEKISARVYRFRDGSQPFSLTSR